MRTLEQQLTNYAAYHRDRRNIATHFVGIPMIVLAAFALLARPSVSLAGLPLSPGLLMFLGGAAFYLALDLRLGLAMLVSTAPAYGFGVWLAAEDTGTWLGAGVGLFVIGWVIQLIGHIFEGRKPAFVDDIVGLLVGPLFLVAEIAFMAGLRPGLREAIELKAGPTRGGSAPLTSA
jgi:uncharacterized membrane protein YGL010W